MVFVCTTTSAAQNRVRSHLLLHEQLLDGPPKIHVLQRDTVTAPVGQEGAASSSSQAGLLVGLQGGDPMGAQKGDRVDPGTHGRAALQWADRRDDQADQNADQAKP